MQRDHSTNTGIEARAGKDAQESSELPAVTVAITSYNHERYIEQAILSVLSQQTDFRVEILVADDCSTDNTPKSIMRLAEANPGRLTILSRPQNLGISANLQDCRDHANGQYLAILEGDDFWTDESKLQRQYEAMQANPDWSMCFTACRVIHDENEHLDFIKPSPFPTRLLTIEDFLQENQVQTMSVAMYRQGVVDRTPEWHADVRIGDWALNMLHAEHGPIGFVPHVCASYRVHQHGLWSGLSSFGRWKEIDTLFAALEQHFEGPLADEISRARTRFGTDFDDRVTYLERIEQRYKRFGFESMARIKDKLKTSFGL